jgi:hypothetical protein
LADPTALGIIDSYGIELIHPTQEGRSPQQIGKKGKSNYRWIAGGKLCLLINQFGLSVNYDWDGANVHDSVFQPLILKVKDQMIVLADQHFHSKENDPDNLKICKRGDWNVRIVDT